tara:strand:- start:1761 stop:2288 length:528 start_codon:yes stop_codon:yes gene_type:complete
MNNLKELALETLTKSVIDKLLVGLMAGLIVWLVQQAITSKMEDISRVEAILNLESGLILDGMNDLQGLFGAYYSDVTSITANGFKMTSEEVDSLRNYEGEFQSSLEVLSSFGAVSSEKISQFNTEVRELNVSLGSDQEFSPDEYEPALLSLRAAYVKLLRALRDGAIGALQKSGR